MPIDSHTCNVDDQGIGVSVQLIKRSKGWDFHVLIEGKVVYCSDKDFPSEITRDAAEIGAKKWVAKNKDVLRKKKGRP